MEQMVVGRTLVIATTLSSSATLSCAARCSSAGSGVVRGLPVLSSGARSCRLLASRSAFSRLRVEGNPGALRAVKEELGGQELAGDFGLQRREFVRNCAASWLLLCTAAMAETTGAQPSSTGSDGAQGTVIFYNSPLAFNPAKARLALEEKNIKYIENKIDLFSGQSLEPWYVKLNPSASAPTLVVGNEKIPESADIIRWADRQGTPLGGDSVDRAFVDEWLSKVDAWDGNLFAAANTGAGGLLKFSTTFKIKVAEANAKRYPELAELYKQKITSMQKNIDEPTDAAIADANRKQLVSLLDEAETRLAFNKFLAGPAYSAADVIFTPVVYRLYQLKKDKDYLDSRPNIKRYFEELKKRPSYKKVFSVSDSGLSSAQQVLPAVGKILFSKVTGKY
ncbi:hypothetical protein M758_6G021500 [Ceratodon purpureus]|nr:hypothetical protein M758_6G021500 [Ceratodon purpureus]